MVGLGVIIYKNWDGIVQYVSDAWELIKSVFEKRVETAEATETAWN